MQPEPLDLPNKALPPARPAWTYFVLAYVALVLAIDTVRSIHFHWAETLYTHAGWLFSMQGWQLRTLTHGWLSAGFLQSFDVFKFVFWFVVPVALCGRRLGSTELRTPAATLTVLGDAWRPAAPPWPC